MHDVFNALEIILKFHKNNLLRSSPDTQANGIYMWLICIQFSQTVIIRVCIYPADKKFGRNQSRSLCFQYKNVLVFYAEIKDGWQMWWHNDFCKKSPVDSPDTL